MRLSRPARRRASGLSYLPPLRPSLDEERSRFLLLSDGLLRVFPTEEVAPDGLVRQASCCLEVSDSFGVKAAAPEHASAVVRLVNGAREKARSLRGGRHREARLQQHDALPDVLEHVDDSQEGGDRHDLRPVELDALPLGVELGQRAARRGFVERLAVVERDRAFDGLDGVVVEERPAVRRLHERRNVERAVPRRAEPVIARNLLGGQPSGLTGQVLDARIEVGVPEAALAEVRRRPGIHMAEVAFAELLVEEDRLAPLGHRALEPQGQYQVLLPPQGQLEGLERVELLVRGQAEIDTGDAVQGLREMLNDRAGRKGPERSIPRCAVSGPPCTGPSGAVHGGPPTEHMRDSPHHERVLQVGESIQIFENQPELPHQRRILEALLQGRVEFGDEEGIVLRQRGDEGRVDGEVVLGRMAGAAGTPVTPERLVEEQVAPLRDELAQTIRGRGSALAAGQPNEGAQNEGGREPLTRAHPASSLISYSFDSTSIPRPSTANGSSVARSTTGRSHVVDRFAGPG